jgi:hypothetical protein
MVANLRPRELTLWTSGPDRGPREVPHADPHLALLHQYQRPVRTVAHGAARSSTSRRRSRTIATANGWRTRSWGAASTTCRADKTAALPRRGVVKAGCAKEHVERGRLPLHPAQGARGQGWGENQLKVTCSGWRTMEYYCPTRAARPGLRLRADLRRGGQDGTRFCRGHRAGAAGARVRRGAVGAKRGAVGAVGPRSARSRPVVGVGETAKRGARARGCPRPSARTARTHVSGASACSSRTRRRS